MRLTLTASFTSDQVCTWLTTFLLPPPTMANRQYQWAGISLSCGVIAVTASLPPAIGRLLSTANSLPWSSKPSPTTCTGLVLETAVVASLQSCQQHSSLLRCSFLTLSQWITFTCVFSCVFTTSHFSLAHLLLTCSSSRTSLSRLLSPFRLHLPQWLF